MAMPDSFSGEMSARERQAKEDLTLTVLGCGAYVALTMDRIFWSLG